jgi:hypothetical protein
MRLKFKSKIGICPCSKPKEAFIVKMHDGKETGRERIGEPSPAVCPYCNKYWNEH